MSTDADEEARVTRIVEAARVFVQDRQRGRQQHLRSRRAADAWLSQLGALGIRQLWTPAEIASPLFRQRVRDVLRYASEELARVSRCASTTDP